MSLYQEHALDGASSVDLVVALYDGMIRFLHSAAAAVDRRDPAGRRRDVRRALDIIVHLQARLRMDIGGKPAEALSEFYASIFAQILQASQGASRSKFEHAIECVREVRDAWRQVARDGEASVAHENPTPASRESTFSSSDQSPDFAAPARWTA